MNTLFSLILIVSQGASVGSTSELGRGLSAEDCLAALAANPVPSVISLPGGQIAVVSVTCRSTETAPAVLSLPPRLLPAGWAPNAGSEK